MTDRFSTLTGIPHSLGSRIDLESSSTASDAVGSLYSSDNQDVIDLDVDSWSNVTVDSSDESSPGKQVLRMARENDTNQHVIDLDVDSNVTVDSSDESSPEKQVLRMARDDLHEAVVIRSQMAESKRKYVRKNSTEPKPEEVSISHFLPSSIQILVPLYTCIMDRDCIPQSLLTATNSNAYNLCFRESNTTRWPKKLWILFERGFVVNKPLMCHCPPRRSTPK